MILVIENPGVDELELKKLGEKLNIKSNFNWGDLEEVSNPKKVKGIISVKKQLNQKELEKFPNLEFIAIAFTGYDSVDLSYCQRKRIAIYNVPDYSSNSVAELCIGLSISLMREIPKAQALIKKGEWDLRPGKELCSKKIGIIGTGNIGVKVASYFKVMGCQLIGWSKSEKQAFKDLGGEYKNELVDLMKEADIVSVHLPLNEKTKGLIGKKEIKSMKKSAYIINLARGPIINETDLIEALEKKEIAGAAVDVFSKEPLPKENNWKELENCLATPHIAYKTEEALKKRAEITLNNIKNHFLKTPINKCN